MAITKFTAQSPGWELILSVWPWTCHGGGAQKCFMACLWHQESYNWKQVFNNKERMQRKASPDFMDASFTVTPLWIQFETIINTEPYKRKGNYWMKMPFHWSVGMSTKSRTNKLLFAITASTGEDTMCSIVVPFFTTRKSLILSFYKAAERQRRDTWHWVGATVLVERRADRSAGCCCENFCGRGEPWS